MEFKEFPKIPRLRREVCITEKIDGTNACIAIGENGEFHAQSRNRIITPEDDNFGFARWAYENKEELLKLGKGYHYGEWWGSKIGRAYGLTNGERYFSLFNVSRPANTIPACCRQVPIITTGPAGVAEEEALRILREKGSICQPGFMKPEGIIVWHTALRGYFKVLLENDEVPKGKVNEV